MLATLLLILLSLVQRSAYGLNVQRADVFVDDIASPTAGHARASQPHFAAFAQPMPARKRQCPEGNVGCFCRDDLSSPCNEDDLVCVAVMKPGYCSRGDTSICLFYGTANCPCAATGCGGDLVCTDGICRDSAPPPPTPAATAAMAPSPTVVGGGVSCDVPDVSPADWFAVLIAGLLLFAALIRWSSQLLSGNKGASTAVARIDEAAADDYLITGGQVLTASSNVPVASFSPLPPPPGTAGQAASPYASSALAVGGREFYRPLPPAPEVAPAARHNDDGVFEIYSKLPSPPPPLAPSFEDRAREMNGVATSALIERRRKRATQRISGGRVAIMSNESVFNWMRRVVKKRVFDQVRVGDVLLAVVYVLLHIGFLFSGETWQTKARALGTTAGYMATVNSMLVALPATRNSLLGLLLGLEYDETIMYHRWLGRWTLILLALHGIPYFPIWFNEWDAFVAYRSVMSKFHWALAALVAAVFLGATSTNYVRRNHFQVFHYSHFVFVLYYVAGSFHSPIMLRQALVTLFFYLFDRLLRFFWGLWPRRCKINQAKEGNIVQVVFGKHRLASYAVGNYVFLNFPQISFWEWHPFTLSSGPYDEYNECHIKALGDFTGKLYERAAKAGALRQQLWLRVDGPYGKFSLNHERYPVVVLVGGGVGVTPQIACLKDVFRIRMSVVARVDHARRGHIKHVYFVWAAPDRSHYMWFHDVFADCLKRHEEDPTYPELHLFCHLSRETEVPPGMPDHVFVGRPDIHAIMGIVCQERQEELKVSQGAVFACGPSKLVNGVWDACTEASKAYNNAHFAFHNETFDF